MRKLSSQNKNNYPKSPDPKRSNWQFAIYEMLIFCLAVPLSILGGSLGTAWGLGQHIWQLSEQDFESIRIEGVTLGVLSAIILGLIMWWCSCRSSLILIVCLAASAFFPLILLFVFTAIVAAG